MRQVVPVPADYDCLMLFMQVGFTKEGIVNGISVNVFSNSGLHPNDESTVVLKDFIDNGMSPYDTIRICKPFLIT